jgi:hypothetical protein
VTFNANLILPRVRGPIEGEEDIKAKPSLPLMGREDRAQRRTGGVT